VIRVNRSFSVFSLVSVVRSVAVATALCALAGPAAAQPSSPAAPRLLVVPFESDQRDAREYWLGEAAAELVTDDLNARGLGAVTRRGRVQAFEQLHLPVATALSRATVIKVGQLVGATQVVVGTLDLAQDTLTVRARPIRIDVGRVDPEITERGPLRDLFPIFDRLSRRLVEGGGAPPTLPKPPLEAFEQYIKGLLAERPPTQATFLETALKLSPGYDQARLALWDVRTGQGDPAAALAVVRAVSERSPFARRARFLRGVSLLQLRQDDEAFTAFKALADAQPDAAVFNNLGVVQIRRGGGPQTGTAKYYLTKAAEAQPDDPDILFNLGYAYALDRDPQGAIYWLRESLRRNPVDADAHFVLASALEAANTTVEAARERELAAQLSSKYADRAKRAGPENAAPPRGLERVRRDLESPRGVDVGQAIEHTAQQDQRELAKFHLDRGRRLFEKEQDREAMAELRRAVYLSPYEAEAHLLIGRIHLREGRPKDAVDALKISIWSQDSAPAHVALAEAYLHLQDKPAARVEVQRALTLDPSSEEAKRLLGRIEGGG
jgi:tetratricopeptide (TPR) repeat protein/TolB-like protein